MRTTCEQCAADRPGSACGGSGGTWGVGRLSLRLTPTRSLSLALVLNSEPGLLAHPPGAPASSFLRDRNDMQKAKNWRPRKKDERRPTALPGIRSLRAGPWVARSGILRNGFENGGAAR